MNKKLVYLLLGLLIVVGGRLLMNEYQKKQLVKEAQENAEEFLYRNYENIDEVAINKENYQFDPMGGLSIGGHVNGKRELFFTVLFDTSNNQVGRVTSVVHPKDFPPNKAECEDNFCQ